MTKSQEAPATTDLQHTLKGVQGGNPWMGYSVWGNTDTTGLQTDISRRRFYKLNSSISSTLERH